MIIVLIHALTLHSLVRYSWLFAFKLDAKPSSYVTILFKTMASTTAHLLHAKLLIVLIVMGPCQAQAFRLLLQDLDTAQVYLLRLSETATIYSLLISYSSQSQRSFSPRRAVKRTTRATTQIRSPRSNRDLLLHWHIIGAGRVCCDTRQYSVLVDF
jgi:hypothetical protein